MKKETGFTLIELMITLAVLVILITIAIPTFQGTTLRSRLSAQVNGMAAAMYLAKSTAAMRGVDVVVCARATDTTCDVSDPPDWTNGWLVFADGNEDGLLASAGDILSVVGGLRSSAYATAKNSGSAIETVFRFAADGMAREPVKYELEQKNSSGDSAGIRCFYLLNGGAVTTTSEACT